MSVPVPKLRFKNFSQALINGPFEQYIKSSKYGPRFDANDYDLNGNVKTIRGTDVALDATIKYEQVPIANLPQKLIDEHQLQEGDILMITTADCGLSAVFEKQEIPFIASAYAVRIVLKNSLDSLWVKYYLQTQHIVNEVNKYVRKGTLSNLPLSDISKFSFTVPALEEQTKIATFLSAVDEKISQLTQKHQLLREYKQGMMQKLFSQQVRFKADDKSEFGEWEEKELKDIAEINPKSKKLPESFIYIDLESVEKGQLLLQKNIELQDAPSRAQRLLAKGDVLFQMVRPYQQNNYYFNLSGEYVASTGYAQIRTKLDSKFIYYALHEKTFLDEVMNRCTGTSYPAINSSDLSSIEILIPCLEEQTKIANFLSAIDQKIEVVAQQIEQAKTWKKGLLQQMFI